MKKIVLILFLIFLILSTTCCSYRYLHRPFSEFTEATDLIGKNTIYALEQLPMAWATTEAAARQPPAGAAIEAAARHLEGLTPTIKIMEGKMSNLKIFNKKKKTYVLILEFSAELSKNIKIEDKEKERYFKQLLKKLLKNDRVVFELYKKWLMIDICFGAQAYEMDKDKSLIKDKHEIDIISPVIDTLPGDAKEHFNKIIEKYDDPSDLIKYFKLLFNRFGMLKVEKANFIEKGK